MYVALAGGVGGARLSQGLSQVVAPDRLLIAVNTGDDFEHLGFSISPDLDTVCYTLAGIEDAEQGWGRCGETWNFMAALSSLSLPSWFRLGDADLALHVLRTQLLRQGLPLSAVTAKVCSLLGVGSQVVPVTDDLLATTVQTLEGPFAFQDYFVRRQCQPVVRGFSYSGADTATCSDSLLRTLRSPALQGVVLCPSNPWLSIGPMLAISALRRALEGCRAPVVAVSPIIGGRALKGPAAKLMAELGLDVSALGIARHYAGLIDMLVIDRTDAGLAEQIEALGMQVLVTNTVMKHPLDRVHLARHVVEALDRGRLQQA